MNNIELSPDGRPVLRGLRLRSMLVLLLLERDRPMTVSELVKAVEGNGFALAGRPGKAVADALRWEVGRGRAGRLGPGIYQAGYVAKVTRHRMRARVAAAWSQAA